MPLFETPSTGGFDDEDSSNDGGARMLEYFVRIEAAESGTNSMKNISEEDSYKKLKQLLAPFVLRRIKNEVMDQILPPKVCCFEMHNDLLYSLHSIYRCSCDMSIYVYQTRRVEWVPFDKAGKKVYDTILENHIQFRRNVDSHRRSRRGRSELGNDELIDDMNISNNPTNVKRNKNIFTELRKAANHPLLLRTRHTSDTDVDELSKQLYQSGYFGRDETCTQTLVKKELESFNDYGIHCAVCELIEENGCLRDALERFTLIEDDLYCSPKFVRLRVSLVLFLDNEYVSAFFVYG